MPPTHLSWVQNVSDEHLAIRVNLDIYPLNALFRVCYLFTDRCYLFLSEDELPSEQMATMTNTVRVRFAKKAADCDLYTIAGEFSNELINQKVRFDIAAETGLIREMIVTQAFTEADLADRSHSGADYRDDPRGISK